MHKISNHFQIRQSCKKQEQLMVKLHDNKYNNIYRKNNNHRYMSRKRRCLMLKSGFPINSYGVLV